MANSESLVTKIEELKRKVEASAVPPQLRVLLEGDLLRLSRMSTLGIFAAEYDSLCRYADWAVNLPWVNRSIDNLDLKSAQEILERNHYGMRKIKDRILEYLSVLTLNAGRGKAVSEVLCFVGLPGIGKTSVTASIAQALGR